MVVGTPDVVVVVVAILARDTAGAWEVHKLRPHSAAALVLDDHRLQVRMELNNFQHLVLGVDNHR